VTPVFAAAVAVPLAMGARAAGWVTTPAAALGAALSWVVLAWAGPAGLALLATFVVSGSLLARGGDRQPVGTRRRAVQVAANGWTAAAGAGLMLHAPDLGWAVFAGGLAAAQADTWATEIGTRATPVPRLITTGARVPAGTSGGVTALGTAGGIAGAGLLSLLVLALGLGPRLALTAGAAGVAGMLADSVLGAVAQRGFRCVRCDARVDSPTHCDATAVALPGWRRLSNDAVNAAATGVGGALGAAATLVG